MLIIKKLFSKIKKHFERFSNEEDFRKQQNRLREFQDRHVGQDRCFIIGNGPSIREQNLKTLKNEVTFVTNWFALHKEYCEISPDYYCISDPRPFEGEFQNSKLSKLLVEKATDTRKFFPYSARNAIRNTKSINDEYVWYINYIAKPIWEEKSISLNPLEGVFTGDTVVIDFCLPLAHFMGFKNVFLIGCDCSNGTYTGYQSKNRHFYAETEHASRQQSDDYLKTHWQKKVFTSYEIAKKSFEDSGRKIFNATRGGKLELFERVDFDSLF